MLRAVKQAGVRAILSEGVPIPLIMHKKSFDVANDVRLIEWCRPAPCNVIVSMLQRRERVFGNRIVHVPRVGQAGYDRGRDSP